MRNSWLLTALLASNLLVTLPAGAQPAATPDGVDNVGEAVTPSDNDQFSDGDAAERLQAQLDRFGGPLTEEDKQALLRSLLLQQQLYGPEFAGGRPPSGVPLWRSLGPTSAKYQTNGVTLKISDSGRVRTILQSPVDPDTVYVLTSGGGLWKTTTFSHTNPRWDPKTDSLLSTSGGSVAFGRSPNTLYLGIGDPFDGLPRLGGVVSRSLDGGETWQAFATLAGATNVRDIKVDTSVAVDIVLAATDVGLFRSTDGGVTFAQVANIAGQGFWSIVRTSAGWLASSGPSTNAFPSPPVVGHLILSTDKGATWSFTGAGFVGAGRATLAVASPGEPVVYAYAGTPDSSAQKDLFRSTNGGVSWTALNITGKTPTNPNLFQPDMNLMGPQAWYNQLILVDPDDLSRQTVYLGGQLATAKTTDGGTSWTELSTWLPYPPALSENLPYVHADCHFATFVTVKGKRGLAFGTDGGVFLSADAGANWDFSKNDGIVSFLSQTVASSAKNPQDVITGMQDTGSRARLGSSGFFNQVVGGDGEGVGWSQANNAYTLATVPGRIYSSTGLLPNTTLNLVNVVGFADGFFFTPIATPSAALDPSGQFFFSAIGRGAIFTNDGGRHWFFIARIGSRLPSSFVIRQVWHTVGLNVGPADGIAIAGAGGRVAVSLDYVHYAIRFLNCPSPNCVPGFQSFVSAPVWAPGNVLYVASENPAPGKVRVVRSTDLGATWVAAAVGLPDTPVYDLVADPRDGTGNTVYAGTAIGVYKTSNGGAKWTLFGAGMPTTPVYSLSIAADGSVLRAALYGRGLWEINP